MKSASPGNLQQSRSTSIGALGITAVDGLAELVNSTLFAENGSFFRSSTNAVTQLRRAW